MSESMIRLPGNSYRTHTHATSTPTTTLAPAEASTAPNANRYAARARSVHTAAQNCEPLRLHALYKQAASGSTSSTARYVTVTLRLRRKPGNTREFIMFGSEGSVARARGLLVGVERRYLAG